MLNKKLGYALIYSSFIFLFIPVFTIFDNLYRWAFTLVNNEESIAILLVSSPIIDFGGSPESISNFMVGTSAVGILLFITGLYVIRRSKLQKL